MSIIYGTINRLEAETPLSPDASANPGLPPLARNHGTFPARILILVVILTLGTGMLLWQPDENPGNARLSISAETSSSIKEKKQQAFRQLSLVEVDAKFVPPLETLLQNTGKSAEPDVVPVQVTMEDPAPAPAPAVELPPQPSVDVRADEVDVAIELARQSLSRGDYQRAIMVLDPLVEDAPERAEYWFLMGSAHLGLGHLEQADMAFASSHAIAPDNVQIAIQQAILKQELDDHVAALQILGAALATHSQVPEIYLNQGYSQLALGAELEARRSFRTFLRMTEDRSLYTQNRLAVKKWLQESSAI